MVGKELDHIRQAVELGQLSGDGPFTHRCHEWLQKRLGCERVFLTHSCTAALEMAAILADLGPGDEVIMPSFTFVSTANAVVLRGAVPVFVDIRSDTLNIDECLIEQAITPRTKAIVAVHYAGTACAMEEIMAIATKHDLLVIEDAAQALMSQYKGRFLGTIGHFGCFSFHETKNIISGEGGALLINDSKFIERAEIIREKGTNRSCFFRGQVDKYTWVDVGSSFLPGELIAAFLYGQLEHADRIINARQQICIHYFESLRPFEDLGFLRLPFCPDDCRNNGHIFYILTKSLYERTRMIDHLNSRGIGAVFHYVPLHSSPAGRKFGVVANSMKITEDVSDRILRLPLFFSMKISDVNRVVAAVREFYTAGITSGNEQPQERVR